MDHLSRSFHRRLRLLSDARRPRLLHGISAPRLFTAPHLRPVGKIADIQKIHEVNVDLGIWQKLSRLMALLIFAAAILAVVVWYIPLFQQNERMRKEIQDLQ